MLQKIKIEKWLLAADIHKKREFYNTDTTVCNCLYCKNYVEACKHLKTSVSDIFNKLGINPAIPAHLSEFPSEEDNTRLYLGEYYLVGRVLEGELCTFNNFNDNNIEIENFKIGFSRDLDFVPRGFPTPALKLGFEANIPWVLNENPED
ncbi:hypothetical protein V1499_06335 [Neobacillus sp. SCS-31]|uniref:hypothetical protein n=1 Tax=Neobacillus oceani TaxID=3115292 RepID=UPI0039069A33